MLLLLFVAQVFQKFIYVGIGIFLLAPKVISIDATNALQMPILDELARRRFPTCNPCNAIHSAIEVGKSIVNILD